jgi:hypothetical protein
VNEGDVLSEDAQRILAVEDIIVDCIEGNVSIATAARDIAELFDLTPTA